MASCAACLRAILQSQRFVIDGTEAFHAACAGQAYRSKQRLSDQRIRELEVQVAATRRAAARVETETNRLRNETTSKAAELAATEGRLATMRHELQMTRSMLVDAQGQADARAVELRAARTEQAMLRAELEALKRTPEVERKEESATDDSALRFKMLELD